MAGQVKSVVVRFNPNSFFRFVENTQQEVKNAIRSGARQLRNNIVIDIQNAPRGGLPYKRYKPRREGIASAAGEVPAPDQGGLVRGIAQEIDGDGYGATISSNAEYSAALEFGSEENNLEPRPFIIPATEAIRPKILKKVKEASKKAEQKTKRGG